MTLHLHRAERTDLLAEGLAELLRTPMDDPFAFELVVVPARGVERWLGQRLSHHLGTADGRQDGVCAGVRFTTPYSLLSDLLGRGQDDPWTPDRLTWPLLESIDEVLDEPWATTLARHLGHGSDDSEGLAHRRDRRWALARRLAGLFFAYGSQRPQMLSDWSAGGNQDGTGRQLAADLLWQPHLWRHLRGRLGDLDPADRLAEALERLAGPAPALDLPARIQLFGHTRLTAPDWQVLHALGRHRDVHLWLPQPSHALWNRLRADPLLSGVVPRGEDTSTTAVAHPLLGSLGRDTRELYRTLNAPAATTDTELLGGGGRQPFGVPNTLLGWLQHDLRGNQLPDETVRTSRIVEADDQSVQIHACHGVARQVDVLREIIVGVLADNPSLEPRDIVVMCPDVETYAPLIAAAFGLGEATPASAEAALQDPDAPGEHPAQRLSVRIADRSLHATNPLLALAQTLVHLVSGRMSATDVVDLAASEPVRLRFGFDDDDLARIGRWIADAGVRWGLDSAHRAQFGLDLSNNTWRAGMDRLLLGAALSEQSRTVVGQTLPLDDVSSGELALVGRLAEFVARLTEFQHAVQRAQTTAQTTTEWLDALEAAVLGLASHPSDEVWQVAGFTRELQAVRAAAGSATTLSLADLRALLDRTLGSRPTRSNFRTGALTVCTLVPMRSVPHRVVCLVGLDDGAFPRTPGVDGDDVLARHPMTGERDVRSEDRQLLLDAVLATTDHLVITYSGAGEHTGLPKPPAVPLGELLDTLDLTASPGLGTHQDKPVDLVRDQVTVRHPLQPFDPRNMERGALVDGKVFSFDRAGLAGAEALVRPRQTPTVLVPEPLAPAPREDISLADLRDFYAHPIRFFLRQRLGLAGVQEATERAVGIPIELDGLENWGVGDRLLNDILDGMDPQSSMLAEQFRGTLPPSALGTSTLTKVIAGVKPLYQAAMRFRTGSARTLDVDIELPDGRRLSGTVTDVFGNNLVHVNYSSLSAKHRLASWIDVLALRLGHEDEMWAAHTIGRYRSAAKHAQINPLDERATGWLHDLVKIYDQGLREPLPLPLKTSLAWVEEERRSGFDDANPATAAAKEWVTDPFDVRGFRKEQDDIWNVRAFGPAQGLEVLQTPLTEAELTTAYGDASHRLAHLARRLWTPLLENERIASA